MPRFLVNHPGTAIIATLLCVCSLTFIWADSLIPWLVLSTGKGTQPYPFAILTNGFVDVGASAFGFLILVLIAAYFNQSKVKRFWRNAPGRVIGITLGCALVLQLIHAQLLNEMGWGLFSALLVSLWIGSAIEMRWGTSRLLSFSGIVIMVTQGLGLGLLWFFEPLREQYIAGAHPLFNAWMTALCLMYGRQRIGNLNLTAKGLIWVLVALDGLALVFDGSLAAFLGLMGILTAWLLMTGRWRLSHLIEAMRLYMLKRRIQRQRSRLRVIDGKKKD